MEQEQVQALLEEVEGQMFSKFLLDSVHLLENIKHTLKGEELIMELREYKGRTLEVPRWEVPEVSKGVKRRPPINTEGYHATINLLQPLLDKISAAGNLDAEEVNLYTRMIIDGLSELYLVNLDEYEFKSESEMMLLVDTILTLIKLQFSKSTNMELIKQLLTRHSINENLDTSDGKNKKQEPGMVV